MSRFENMISKKLKQALEKSDSDVENGPDSEDSKSDELINAYATRVNELLMRMVLSDFSGTMVLSDVSETSSDTSPVQESLTACEKVKLMSSEQPNVSEMSSKSNDFHQIMILKAAPRREEPIITSVMESSTEEELAKDEPIISSTSSKFPNSVMKPLKEKESALTTEKEDDIRKSALTTESDEKYVSPMKNTLMHIAALCGNDKWVEELLAKNKSHLLAKKNCNGDTPLHVAARFSHKKTIEKLLVALVRNLRPPYPEKPKEALDKILVKNEQGNTFFHNAVLKGQTDVMKILDDQELDIEPGFKELVRRAALFWTNKEEKSILDIAIEKGYEDIVDDALNRLSPHHALNELIQNHQELAQTIPEATFTCPQKDQGIEINKQQKNIIAMDTSEDPQSQLFRIGEVLSNYMTYVDMEILKDYSQNISPRNRGHKRLSRDSSTDKFSEKYQQEPGQFIPRGHDYAPSGESLLVAISEKRYGILNKIREKKKEWILRFKDNEGRTVIHHAASIGNLDVVKFLLRLRIDCNMKRDNNGFFPLHSASEGGHVDVIKELLKGLASAGRHEEEIKDQLPEEVSTSSSDSIEGQLVDNDGRNFIHIAAKMGNYRVIRYMLDRPHYPQIEKMINSKDVHGNTPLHLATLRCHPRVVHALAWDKRMDCNILNKRNETALHICMQFQQEQELPSLRQRLIRIALESVGSRTRTNSKGLLLKLPSRPQNAKNDRKQEGQKKDMYKDRINTLMLVSTLITTVTFAAGFTLPGGTNSSDPEKGMALMLNHVWFKLFVFCITISMYGAISVTIILIWAHLGDINLTRLALKVTMPLLGITLTTLSVAFMAGVHLVISDLSWLATALLVLCVISIIMLVALYILLWFFSSSGSKVVRYVLNYPLKFLIWLDEQGQTHEARFC